MRVTHNDMLRKAQTTDVYLTSYGKEEVDRGGAYAYCVGLKELRAQILVEIDAGGWEDTISVLNINDIMATIKSSLELSNKVILKERYEVILVQGPKDIEDACSREAFWGDKDVYPLTQIEHLEGLLEVSTHMAIMADDLYRLKGCEESVQLVSGYDTMDDLKHFYKQSQKQYAKLKREYMEAGYVINY